MDRNVLLAVAAAQEAWDDAAIEDVDPARVGILVGSAIGGIATIAEQQRMFLRARRRPRLAVLHPVGCSSTPRAARSRSSSASPGPNYAPVSACATGSTAIGEGAATIVRGQADIVLAGGTEAAIIAADPGRLLRHARARGRGRGSDPRDAPLRRDAGRLRDGGGGVHPRPRGAARRRRPAARRSTRRCSATAPRTMRTTSRSPSRRRPGVAAMITAALAAAGVAPERVGYVNAHGTSTPLGDLAETRALRQVFGKHAYELAVSSTKSVTGALLRGRRGGRGDDVRAGAAPPAAAADDQLPERARRRVERQRQRRRIAPRSRDRRTERPSVIKRP